MAESGVYVYCEQRGRFAEIGSPTAPVPISGMANQSSGNWIGMDVVQFFFLLALSVDIEIVEAGLPEAPEQPFWNWRR